MAENRVEQNCADRAPGVLAVHSLDHFALSVPDLAAAKFFFSEFGLDVREVSDELELYTFGDPHRWAVIRKGPRKHLDYLSFGAFEDDMQRLRERVVEHGVELIDPPAGGSEDGIWFRNPDGMPIQVVAAAKCSPAAKSTFETVSVGPGETAALPRSKAPRVQPRRLSHFLVFSSDVLRDIDFYRETLGLRLADRSADIVAFLYAPHGSDHHMLALAGSTGPGMHHSSWDVASIQDIGLGASHMASVGFDKGWGLGRHVLGANYFQYVRDPWGSFAEYSCDIDFIPAGFEWPTGDHAPEDALYLWGPPVPEDFITNHEVTVV